MCCPGWIAGSVLFSGASTSRGKSLCPSSSVDEEEAEAIEDMYKVGAC